MDAVVKSFADDTKTAKVIKNVNDVEDMQNILDKIVNWELENNMVFSTKKFKLLQIGKNQELKDEYTYENNSRDGPFLPSESTRDLGLTISREGNYKVHIENTIKKVNQKTGWFLRAFKNREKYFMRFIWKTYLIPKLEYCSQLWGPCEGPLLLKLENLQRAFTTKVNGLRDKS